MMKSCAKQFRASQVIAIPLTRRASCADIFPNYDIYIYIYIYYMILDGWPSNIDYIGRRKLYWTRRSRVQYNLSESNIIYIGRSTIQYWIYYYKNQSMRKHINVFRKWRNIENIFIKSIDTALVRQYRVRRVPVASFWNCPIYPILDSCPLTVQYSFWKMKYKIYWMITWGKSAFVIGQLVYSG